MRETDLDQVLWIERAAFPSPWKREHFLHELRHNPYAVSWVLADGDRIVGYTCLWQLHEELKINNIAIHPDYRRRGLGARLLRSVLRYARESGCREASLEVRPSNRAARELYRKNGFVEKGRRKNYYQLEREDAVLMAVRLGAT